MALLRSEVHSARVGGVPSIGIAGLRTNGSVIGAALVGAGAAQDVLVVGRTRKGLARKPSIPLDIHCWHAERVRCLIDRASCNACVLHSMTDGYRLRRGCCRVFHSEGIHRAAKGRALALGLRRIGATLYRS